MQVTFKLYFNSTKYKRYIKILKKNKKSRLFLESKIDNILLKLGLFKSFYEIKKYLKKKVININEIPQYNLNYILKNNDRITFSVELQIDLYNRFIYKLKNAEIKLNFPYFYTYSLNTFSFIFVKDLIEQLNYECFYYNNFIDYKNIMLFNKCDSICK